MRTTSWAIQFGFLRQIGLLQKKLGLECANFEGPFQFEFT
jgi:hypothetical protein